MTPHKSLMTISQHVFARPLRDFLLSKGYTLLHVATLDEANQMVERRRCDGVIIDYKLLLQAHNGHLPELPGKGFKAVMVPASQLVIMQTYLKQQVIHDYILTPPNKGQLACLLQKIDTFHHREQSFDKMALEELVEKKLLNVLQKLDLDSMRELHDIIMPRLERPLIKMVLGKTAGNQLKAAQVLGINRNTLRSKLKQLHIDHK